jgi:hypothetical protein
MFRKNVNKKVVPDVELEQKLESLLSTLEAIVVKAFAPLEKTERNVLLTNEKKHLVITARELGVSLGAETHPALMELFKFLGMVPTIANPLMMDNQAKIEVQWNKAYLLWAEILGKLKANQLAQSRFIATLFHVITSRI